MSEFRLFVCVDGSAGALAAIRLALEIAQEHGGEIRAVSVVKDEEATRKLADRESAPGSGGDRFERAARSLLDRIRSMADEREVAIETILLRGSPLRAILRDAERWGPDLIVIGRTGRGGPGSPMIGSLATQVIEFSDHPVVVVPAPD